MNPVLTTTYYVVPFLMFGETAGVSISIVPWINLALVIPPS